MSHEAHKVFSTSIDGGEHGILVHGGAGAVPAARIASHVEGCEAAARAGALVLEGGGHALDAVQRAVEALEANPHFNAGIGASLNEHGDIELDASIMCGRELRAGGVCALPPFMSPIAIARRVLEEGTHVLLAGEAAATWAVREGFERVDREALMTDAAREKLARVLERGDASMWAGGTVGAVARDAHGNVAAATSTGGTVNKRAGRVGDSPIPGAGTYADDRVGACSCTGQGEAILRLCLARRALEGVASGASHEVAAARAIAMLGERVSGLGGLIVAAPDGTLALARNTRTMSWASESARAGKRSGA